MYLKQYPRCLVKDILFMLVMFCSTKCAVQFCMVLVESGLCELHRCRFPRCTQRRTGADWCDAHVCKHDGCTNGISAGKLCVDHACMAKSCYNHRNPNTGFCTIHASSDEDCCKWNADNKKMSCSYVKSQNSNYCHRHTCEIEGCFESVALVIQRYNYYQDIVATYCDRHAAEKGLFKGSSYSDEDEIP